MQVSESKIKELAKLGFNFLVDESQIYPDNSVPGLDYELAYDCPWDDENVPSQAEQELWFRLIKAILEKA